MAGSRIDNIYSYTSREYDVESGLMYYFARYRSLSTGGFIQEDPIEFGGGSNFYAYVKNNPLKYVDPIGLKTIVIVGSSPVWWQPGHAGLYIIRDGGILDYNHKIAIYDPQGGFSYGKGGADEGGRSRVFLGDDLKMIKAYQAYQRMPEGWKFEAFLFDTTPEEEKAMLDAAMEQEDWGFSCTNNTSGALATAKRFKGAQHLWPSRFAEWLRKHRELQSVP